MTAFDRAWALVKWYDEAPSDYFNNTPMFIQDLLAHSGGDCDRCGENVPNGQGYYPKADKELGEDDDTRICLPCFEADPNFTIYGEDYMRRISE